MAASLLYLGAAQVHNKQVNFVSVAFVLIVTKLRINPQAVGLLLLDQLNRTAVK